MFGKKRQFRTVLNSSDNGLRTMHVILTLI